MPRIPTLPAARPVPAALALLALVWVASSLLGTGCSPGGHAPSEPRSLVILSIDTLRADRLGTYGYFRDTSPVLDAFADESLLFENAIAPAATTLPSHVSIMTGTHPIRHGIHSNFLFLKRPLEPREGLQTLAQMLTRAGYRTAGFTSAAPLSRVTGIDTGFGHFEAPPPYDPAAGRPGEQYRADRTVDAAIAWIRDAERPFFAFVHLFDPHSPYDPPEPFADAFEPEPALLGHLSRLQFPSEHVPSAVVLSNRYDGEVRFADREIGRFLGFLEETGRLEDTVVVVTSDHGEGLFQHGVLEHGVLFNEQIRVPLMFRFPDGPRGRRSELASLVDIAPTLAGRGFPLDAGQFDGVDLLEEGRTAALSQRDLRKQWPEVNFTLTEPEWKYWYLEKSDDRLYHLATDPHEMRDVIGEHPEEAARLRRDLLDRVERYRSRQGLEVTDEVPEAVRDQLRALGYVE